MEDSTRWQILTELFSGELQATAEARTRPEFIPDAEIPLATVKEVKRKRFYRINSSFQPESTRTRRHTWTGSSESSGRTDSARLVNRFFRFA